jgi:hypothetical protein
LELYEDDVILNYYLIANESILRGNEVPSAEMRRLGALPDRDRRSQSLRDAMPRIAGRDLYLRLQDDLGTTYPGLQRGGHGGNERWETSYGFTTAVPAKAKALRVLVFEGDLQRQTGEATKRDPEHLVHTLDLALR